MTARRRMCAPLLVAALLCAPGCTLLSPAEGEAERALLTAIPSELPLRDTRPATLLVLPPETQPVYDTTQMAYTTRPYQVDYFRRYAWGATPSRMLLPLVVKTLEQTHAFRAVLTPPYAGRYDYALRTQILELTQDFTGEPAVLRLSLRVELSTGVANRTVAVKDISVREPMPQKTPYAGVIAANSATAMALRAVAQFVLEQTN